MPHSYRLDGLFALRSPLSHIGEAISTTTYLVQEPVLQPDGSLEEVFVYAGNAWRGQLRDLSAEYMLDRIGNPKLGLDSFHLLFSGGRIGGAQSTDLAQARRLRSLMPHLALFGGGVGNQILGGKLRVGGAYPVCREALPVLPEDLAEAAEQTPYSGLTFEKSFSRRDDSAVEALAHHLPPPDPVLLAHGAGKAGKGAGKTAKTASDKTASEPVPQQMRMTSELLAAGTRLYSWIDVLDASEVELGCLVAALHRFARSPHIGGQSARGHGRVALTYRLADLDSSSDEVLEAEFVQVDERGSRLGPQAQAARAAYDAHLRSLYDAHLEDAGAAIAGLLGAA